MVAIQRKREEQEARDKRINEFQSRIDQILKKYLEDQAPERKGGNGRSVIGRRGGADEATTGVRGKRAREKVCF